MSFLIRAVLILLIFAFVVYVIKAIARLSFRLRSTVKDVEKLRDQMGGKPVASADMVRCTSCGAYVSKRDAVTISTGNRSRVFCSQICARAHVA